MCMSYKGKLTHNLEQDVIANSSPRVIGCSTGIIPSGGFTYTLKYKTLVAKDDSSRLVVMKHMSLHRLKDT